ncbi:HAD-IIA family hydrolase [Kitasatospora nipponensis]|uniref:HAD-IIA family hydrolase n=1 Tax=Kitasatospora nipponensis TaxID=258049 RepID=A0ABN1WJ26_9ACTN
MAVLDGALIDIDGVLTLSWRPIPGAVRALTRLREADLPFVLLTNTTSRTRSAIAATLGDLGFPVTLQDILTAPAATAGYLAEHHPGARCLLLNSGDVRQDLAGVTLVDGSEDGAAQADLVLLGGAGPAFHYASLNRAFGLLQHGAPLVAMHRNLYWRTDRGLQLDVGAFLPGLERAANVRAEVIGKPARPFFTAALELLGTEAERTVMVGDDIASDVLAAQRLGITGALVRTGKYQEHALHDADAAPDHVLDSVADLPDLILTRPP